MKRRENKKPETFDFLGFTHYCNIGKEGQFRMKRKTSRKKLRAKVQEMKQWLRKRMHCKVSDTIKLLNIKLVGYYRYYGITDNTKCTRRFYEMRGFSKHTKASYYRKAKEITEYFKKPMRQVKIQELRDYLLKYLRQERGLTEKSVNYYNNVIRFIYDVVIDVPINKRQLPLYKGKRRLPKILSYEELNVFFNACENYKYKTIFMMIYGSGLRISEATNIRVADIDSKNMRIFVRNGKGERERYTVLPKASLEMLRECYRSKNRPYEIPCVLLLMPVFEKY